MATARNPRKTFEHVLERELEKPEHERTVFILRPISEAMQVEIEDFAVSSLSSGGSTRAGYLKLKALKASLVGWRGYVDESGFEVPFPANPGDAVQMVYADDQAEIFRALLDEARLSKAEKKSSA